MTDNTSQMTDITSKKTLGKGARIVSWTLQVLLACGFFAAGGAKLMSAPPMVEMFDQIGFGQWFRYVTGVVEVGGAIALLIPFAIPYGAILLTTTMFCAVLTHLFIIHTNPAAAVVLLVLSATVIWLRRSQIQAGNRTKN
jgi:putative oxidoreductase